jgi:hypothetical protein
MSSCDDYREVVGDTAAFDLPLLVAGYALVAIVITLVYRWHPSRPDWIRAGAAVGVGGAAATFVGVHLVQAGYSVIDNTAWVLSGVLDAAGPVPAGLAVGYVTDRPAATSRRLVARRHRHETRSRSSRRS